MKIVVKSDPIHFLKEKLGVKPNTVRWLDGKDIIVIINTETGEKIERTITDITTIGDTTIISFIPAMEVTLKKVEKKLPKKVVKKPKRKRKRTGTPGRPDSDKIIADLRSKKYTKEEIEKKFDLKGTRIYYWLKKADMTINELPKERVEIPKEIPSEEPTSEPPLKEPDELDEEWEDDDTFDEV